MAVSGLHRRNAGDGGLAVVGGRLSNLQSIAGFKRIAVRQVVVGFDIIPTRGRGEKGDAGGGAKDGRFAIGTLSCQLKGRHRFSAQTGGCYRVNAPGRDLKLGPINIAARGKVAQLPAVINRDFLGSVAFIIGFVGVSATARHFILSTDIDLL